MMNTHRSRWVIDLPNPKIKPFKEILQGVGRKKGDVVLGEMAMFAPHDFYCRRVDIGDFDCQETAQLENAMNHLDFLIGMN